jgi:hypothetical protein
VRQTRGEDNIKMNVKDMKVRGMNCVHATQDKDIWVLVNTVKFLVP